MMILCISIQQLFNCVYLYVWICICIYVYLYIYIYVYMYIYIYISMYISYLCISIYIDRLTGETASCFIFLHIGHHSGRGSFRGKFLWHSRFFPALTDPGNCMARKTVIFMGLFHDIKPIYNQLVIGIISFHLQLLVGP